MATTYELETCGFRSDGNHLAKIGGMLDELVSWQPIMRAKLAPRHSFSIVIQATSS